MVLRRCPAFGVQQPPGQKLRLPLWQAFLWLFLFPRPRWVRAEAAWLCLTDAAEITKVDRMLADQHDISVLKHHLADSAIVDIGAIKALGIFESIVVAFPVDLGVMSGHGGII